MYQKNYKMRDFLLSHFWQNTMDQAFVQSSTEQANYKLVRSLALYQNLVGNPASPYTLYMYDEIIMVHLHSNDNILLQLFIHKCMMPIIDTKTTAYTVAVKYFIILLLIKPYSKRQLVLSNSGGSEIISNISCVFGPKQVRV